MIAGRTLRDRMLEVQEASRTAAAAEAAGEPPAPAGPTAHLVAARERQLAKARERFAELPPAERTRLLHGIQDANDEAEHIRTYRRPD